MIGVDQQVNAQEARYANRIAYRYYEGIIADETSAQIILKRVRSVFVPITFPVLVDIPEDRASGGARGYLRVDRVPMFVNSHDLITKVLELVVFLLHYILGTLLGGRIFDNPAVRQVLRRLFIPLRRLIGRLLRGRLSGPDYVKFIRAFNPMRLSRQILGILNSVDDAWEILAKGAHYLDAYTIYPPLTPVLLFSPSGDPRDIYIVGALVSHQLHTSEE